MKANWIIIIFLIDLHFSKHGDARNAFYEDVKELFACPYRECATRENWRSLMDSGCDCGVQCTGFGTCCADSPYRSVPVPQLKPACTSLKGNFYGYFMIDQCPADDNLEAAWKQLCGDDNYNEVDPIRLIPVTSLLTNVTYKNYFCFRCHEAHEDYVFWHLSMTSNQGPDTEIRDESIKLSYNNVHRTWRASFEEGGALFDVFISIGLNNERYPDSCIPNVISTCSKNWKDDEIRSKCNAYTFITDIEHKYYTYNTYRNPHCALCNFEKLNLTTCSRYISAGGFGGGGGSFSFTHLLDFNSPGGPKVGVDNLCNATSVWDKHFKKCRTISCIVPGYVISNGKCVPP